MRNQKRNKHGVRQLVRLSPLFLGVFSIAFFLFLQYLQPKNPVTAKAEVHAASTDLCTAGLDDSDGSGDGILDLTASELGFDNTDVAIINCTIAIDGTHTFTSLTVGDGGGGNDSVLTTSDTTSSAEYKIDITTTGDFTILSDGSVDVAGKGYLGGLSSGSLSSFGYTNGNTTSGGSRNRAGGSYGGLGGTYSTDIVAATYGSLTAPVSLGAGGGETGNSGGVYGGDGGGAIHINGATVTNNGTISANGQDGYSGTSEAGGGAGGSAYIEATTFSGAGIISADGGDGGASGTNECGGGGGRISIVVGTNNYTGSYSAHGGQTLNAGANGGAGTIFRKLNSQTNGDLYVDNGSLTSTEESTPLPSTPITLDSVTLTNLAKVRSDNLATITGTLSVDNSLMTFGVGSQISVDIVTLANSATLTHAQTTTTTEYSLDINATTSITVDATSGINADERGYLGALHDGSVSTWGYTNGNTTSGGSRNRSGGSHGGVGGQYSTDIVAASYGSVTAPTTLGGGGAEINSNGGVYGGDGGGAVHLQTPTLTNNGTISSNGGNAYSGTSTSESGGGAGGSLYIDVTTLNGSGSFSAIGGNGGAGGTNECGGGGGRIAILTTTNNFTGTYAAYGGQTLNAGSNGGAGTIYKKLASETDGRLYIDNNGLSVVESSTVLPATPTAFDSVSLSGGARIESTTLATINGAFTLDNAWYTAKSLGLQLSADSLTLTNNSLMTHTETAPSGEYSLKIQVTNAMSIDATSQIDVDGRGYTGGLSSGNVSTYGYTNGNTSSGGTRNRSGGSHGGDGGKYSTDIVASPYDSLETPTKPGGGGATTGNSGGSHGGDGGGAVYLVSGTFSLNGNIKANANPGVTGGVNSGGGAGGGVYISTGTFSGSGAITADGGDGGSSGTGEAGGAGGRIAIYYDTNTFTGSITAYPGQTLTGTNEHGAAGTVYVKDNAGDGSLTVNNNNLDANSNTVTPLFITGEPSSYNFLDVAVINEAELLIDSPCSGTPAVTVSGTIDLSNNGLITNNQPGTCTISASTQTVSSTATLGVLGQAYSKQLQSPGGYAPKSYVCKDGPGGSVVACDNANAGLPPGLTMSSAGLISGTPTLVGIYQFVVEVTDSDPSTPQVTEQTVSLTIDGLPLTPTLVSPTVGSNTSSLKPTLVATYSDPDAGDTGHIDFRVSSSSASDCINNINISAIGTSPETATNNENASFTLTTDLTDGITYYWCARAYDGAQYDNSGTYSSMGNFIATAPSGSNQLQQQPGQEPVDTSLSVPQIGIAKVLSSTQVRYDWSYLGSNQLGFRILDSGNAIKVEVPDPLATTTVEGDLPNNTLITGRAVVAFNSNGQSPRSLDFPPVVTYAPVVRPVFLSRSFGQIQLGISQTVNNLNLGSSGIQYEVYSATTVFSSAEITQSDWVQQDTYTFDVPDKQNVQLRTRARNQEGVVTEWSPYLDIPSEVVNPAELQVSLSLKTNGELPVPVPTDLSTILAATVTVKNIGGMTAQDVVAELPIPGYVIYIPGSLMINGVKQTDLLDSDAGQVTAGEVSAKWDSLAPAESKTMVVHLGFDQQALAELDLTKPAIIITLQASAGAANITGTTSGNIVELQPNFGTSVPIEQEPVSEQPVPEPTQPETKRLDEFLDQMIEQETQQTGGDTGNPIERPTLTPEEMATTESSSDGQSFTLTVTRNTPGAEANSPRELTVTGLAAPTKDQIEFTGTTSEPNTVVTLILDENVTLIATSDDEGYWQTYVSAAQLGVEPGQSRTVTVEVVAAKDDLQSEKANVGSFTLQRSTQGEVVAQFPTIVSASDTVAVLRATAQQVRRAVEQNEPQIQQTLTVTAPIVVVSSAPLWGYLPYIPTLLYHFITYLIGLLGRKKKKQRYQGTVYDAISKDPLGLAIIRVYAQGGRLVATQVSDKQGHYDFLLKPGTYRIEVRKPQYVFPSKIVRGEQDGKFTKLYQPQSGVTVQNEEIVVPDVPLDPQNAQITWQASNIFKKIWISLQKVGHYLAVPILFVGALASLVVVASVPNNPINWILAIVYVVMFLFQLKLRQKIEKAWGVVYDIATDAPLPLTTLQLIDPEFGKIVKTRLSDYQGRFRFAPEPGSYILKAEKQGFQPVEIVEAQNLAPKRHPITGPVAIQKAGQNISGDVPMKQM